jgi:hypothetical protein
MPGGKVSNKRKGIVIAVAAIAFLTTWIVTAPYPGNTGWERTPGVILGGTPTPAPSDFTPLNEVGRTLKVKFAGFPPFVVYLNFVGTPDGVITATRPDGGYWAQRVRDRGGDGLLRIGDQTFEMTATEVLGEARIPLLEQYGRRSGMSMDRPTAPGLDPLRDWEVFFWTPR